MQFDQYLVVAVSCSTPVMQAAEQLSLVGVCTVLPVLHEQDRSAAL
jgi:hypothetical protein